MGYELDRLKNLYGVGTASKALYSGPDAPTPLGSNATAQQIAEYDVAASPYRQGQQAYQNYLAEYDRRLASANPYDQPQFRTPPSTPVNRPPVLTSPDYRSIATRDMATVTGASPGATAGRSTVYGDTLDLGDLGNTNLSQQEQFYLSRLGYQQFPGNADALRNYYNWYAAMNPGTTMTQDLLRQLGGTTGSTTGSTTSGTTGGNTNVLTDAYNKWTGNTTTGSTTGGFTGGNVGGLTGVIGGIISEANGGVGSFTNGGTTGGATTGTTTGETTGKSNVYGESLGLEDLGNPNLSLQNQFDLARMGYEQFPNDPAALTNYYNWYAAMNPGTTMTQDDLRNQQFNIGMPGSYARGGHVRTHYQTGGGAETGDPLADIDRFYSNPQNFRRPTPLSAPSSYRDMRRAAAMNENVEPPSVGGIPVEILRLQGEPMPGVGEGGTPQAEIPAPIMPPQIGEGGTPQPLVGPTVEPAAAGAPAATPAGGGSLQDMLARYMRASTSGGSELAEARRRYQSESDAFYGLIRQMAERGESPTSRAEMYFRLASAFGSPTRTGSPGETLAKVGEQMGEYTKGRRAEESERRNLLMQAQQARMAGAREDLTTTRALAAQEATERRALNAALLQEYIRSGQPQSNAGRMARDAGLTPGTQAFQDFVTRHADLDVQRAQQLIQTQNENLTLRREAADRLSATEIKLADETSQNISSARDNALLLREAIRLNPNASPSNLTEGVITDLRRRLGSTDPLVVNTADIRNILSRLTLGSLKETFPGAISNDERRALEAVSGVTAASREERARIMQRASDALERIVERNEAQLRRIRSGEFGRIDRTQGGTQ